tara:strand:+ start:51 stop:773 length:723 start_codon:yes stop_codon:yes gene_type:complete
VIYIFGDSYGDARSNETPSSAWYNMLKHHEDVKNYCIGAIGPIDHFKLFWQEYDNICKNKSAKIVFLLSSPFRLNFDFLEESSHAKELGDFAMFGDAYYKYFYQYKDQIKSFMKFIGDELWHLNYKNIMTLKCISLLHDIKIIVFVCFSVNLDLMSTETCKNDDYITKLTKLNDEKFKLYSNILSTYGRDYDSEEIECQNHFFVKDHEIMYNIIANYFYGGNRSEIFDQGTNHNFRYIYQ